MECFKEYNMSENRELGHHSLVLKETLTSEKGTPHWGNWFCPSPWSDTMCAHSLSLPVSHLDPLGAKCP